MHVHVPNEAARPRPVATLLARRRLPRMGRAQLARHLRSLPERDLALARRHRFLPLPHCYLQIPATHVTSGLLSTLLLVPAAQCGGRVRFLHALLS